jgi:hypothetical protein
MILGKTYKQVRKDWLNNFATEGMDLEHTMNYLGENGCSIIHKTARNYIHKDFARKEMLRPFAPSHILRLLSHFDAKNGHVVVMDKTGKIYCPGGYNLDEIMSAYAITDVIGLWR